MIGLFCRTYRIEKGLTLKQVEGSDDVKTLSAFEMGRSTNIHHLTKYLHIANNYGELDMFVKGLYASLVRVK